MSADIQQKGGWVRNPLSLIAIFAGLAEVSAAAAFPHIEPTVQSTFVWFVMLFPTYLVSIFFLTLWRRPYILFGPSDFRTDEGWLSLYPGLTVGKKPAPGDRKYLEDESIDDAASDPNDSIGSEPSSVDEINATRRAKAYYNEQVVLQAFQNSYGERFRMNVALYGSDVVFDGIVQHNESFELIEVLYLSRSYASASRLRRLYRMAKKATAMQTKSFPQGGTLHLIIIVGSGNTKSVEEIKNRALPHIDGLGDALQLEVIREEDLPEALEV